MELVKKGAIDKRISLKLSSRALFVQNVNPLNDFEHQRHLPSTCFISQSLLNKACVSECKICTSVASLT